MTSRSQTRLTEKPRPPRLVRLVLTAAFSGLYLVFRAIPTFPSLLFPGTLFRAGDIVAPLYGIILGPFLGPAAIIIGTVGGYFSVAPPVFLGLDFLPAATCASVVGLLIKGKRTIAGLIFAIILAVFIALPYSARVISVNGSKIPYNWFHIVGLAILVSPVAVYAIRTVSLVRNSRLGTHVDARVGGSLLVSVLVVALIGTLAQHLVGGILTESVVGLNFHAVPARFASWQAFWTVVFYVYPIERSIISILAALLTAPVLLALRSSRLQDRIP